MGRIHFSMVQSTLANDPVIKRMDKAFLIIPMVTVIPGHLTMARNQEQEYITI